MTLPDLGKRINQRCLIELDLSAPEAYQRDAAAYDHIVADEIRALA